MKQKHAPQNIHQTKQKNIYTQILIAILFLQPKGGINPTIHQQMGGFVCLVETSITDKDAREEE